MAAMGDDVEAGTVVRSGHGLRYPHDRREPCLSYIQPSPLTRASPTRQARTMPRPWLRSDHDERGFVDRVEDRRVGALARGPAVAVELGHAAGDGRRPGRQHRGDG